MRKDRHILLALPTGLANSAFLISLLLVNYHLL